MGADCPVQLGCPCSCSHKTDENTVFDGVDAPAILWPRHQRSCHDLGPTGNASSIRQAHTYLGISGQGSVDPIEALYRSHRPSVSMPGFVRCQARRTPGVKGLQRCKSVLCPIATLRTSVAEDESWSTFSRPPKLADMAYSSSRLPSRDPKCAKMETENHCGAPD